MEQQRELRRRERRQQITGVQVVFVSILAIGLLLTINFSARIRRGQLYHDLKIQAEGTLTALEEENLALRQELDFVQSDSAVARWAHREGKMVKPGEVLVIPIPALGGAATPTPPPRNTPIPSGPSEPDVPVWQLWWSLFFDNDPP